MIWMKSTLAAVLATSIAAMIPAPAGAAPPRTALEKALQTERPRPVGQDGFDRHENVRPMLVDHRKWRRHDRRLRRHHPHHRHQHWAPPPFFGFGFGHGWIEVYPPRAYRLPRIHVIWCDRRYKTYRHYDNTYIPRIGVRAVCRSPYWP